MEGTQVKAILRMARISAFKARAVTRHIQGLAAEDAMDILRFSPQKAAKLVRKTLKSAIANAENNAGLSSDRLLVKEAVVGEGPTFKRSQPKARGSAGPIRKRTSHIRIVLTEAEANPSAQEKSKKKSQKNKKSASPRSETKSVASKQNSSSKKKEVQANQSSDSSEN